MITASSASIPTGWRCPVCSRVYAPAIPACSACVPRESKADAEATCDQDAKMSPADLRRRHAELQRECAVSARETQNTMNASLESHIERIRHRMERIELYNGVMMKRLAQIVDLHRSESSSSSGP